MEKIIEYIKQTYKPLSIILYGSYANGTNDWNSDFDALIISRDHEQYHDTSRVNGIQLDVFVYPASYFEREYDCREFVQILDGKIITDSENLGERLRTRVESYLRNRPEISVAKIQADVDWCEKMLERAGRDDAEGRFRWHWLLVDSLEIFCDIKQHPYFGPKKTLRWMKENHSDAFFLYENALTEFSMESLERWVSYLKGIKETVQK